MSNRRPGACDVIRCRADGGYEVHSISQSVALLCRPHAERLGRIVGSRVVVDVERSAGWIVRVPDDKPGTTPVIYPPEIPPPEFLGSEADDD